MGMKSLWQLARVHFNGSLPIVRYGGGRRRSQYKLADSQYIWTLGRVTAEISPRRTTLAIKLASKACDSFQRFHVKRSESHVLVLHRDSCKHVDGYSIENLNGLDHGYFYTLFIQGGSLHQCSSGTCPSEDGVAL
eukprot:scaffold435_cov342-Pavlova_lutheri.AAC.12